MKSEREIREALSALKAEAKAARAQGKPMIEVRLGLAMGLQWALGEAPPEAERFLSVARDVRKGIH